MSRDRIVDVLNALEAEGWELQSVNGEPSNKRTWMELVGGVLEWELVNRRRGLVVQLEFQAVGHLGRRTKDLMDVQRCEVRDVADAKPLYFCKRKSRVWREDVLLFAKDLWRHGRDHVLERHTDKRKQLVKINLRSVRTTKQLHLVLMRSLDFPDWYGRNWDAFWDAISGLVEMPYVLRFAGWEDFALRLPKDAEVMRQCLEELPERYPQFAPQVEYR